jgi:hypothetical protein
MKIPKMMIKQRLVQASTWVLSSLRRHKQRMHRRTWLLRFKRRELVVGLRDGGVYSVPLVRPFEIRRRENALEFVSAGVSTSIEFADADASATVLRIVQRRLMSNRSLVWILRLLGLSLGWLLLSSYLHVRSEQQQLLAIAAAANSGPNVPTLPDESAGYKTLPSTTAVSDALPPIAANTSPDNAAVEAEQMAIQAQQQAKATSGTPAAASDTGNGAGLDGFGLQAAGMDPSAVPSAPPTVSVPPSAVATTTQTAPGCDPHLAFKAPAY